MITVTDATGQTKNEITWHPLNADEYAPAIGRFESKLLQVELRRAEPLAREMPDPARACEAGASLMTATSGHRHGKR